MAKGPLYRQIRNALTERLHSLDWKPGEALPAEAVLAETFACSIGTLRKAIDGLAEDGVLNRVQGRGTFVVAVAAEWSPGRFHPLTDAEGTPAVFGIGRQVSGTEAADERLAGALGIEPGAAIFQVDRILTCDGQRVAVETISVAAALMPGLEALIPVPEALYPLYQDRYGLFALRVADCIGSLAADDATARQLGVAPGAPLLSIDRITYGLGDTALDHRRIQVVPDGLTYTAERR